MEEVFQATYAFEQFALEYAQYHLNKTTPNLSINSQEIGKGKNKQKWFITCSVVVSTFTSWSFCRKKNPKFFCQKKKIKIKKKWNKLY